HPPFILIHPPFILIHPPFILIHPPFILIHPPQNSVHPPHRLIHPPFILKLLTQHSALSNQKEKLVSELSYLLNNLFQNLKYRLLILFVIWEF
ncbi:hypothetical protein, partial [Nostoc sp.]|uniref:hypothetical protein n=1 Tax=Nostoc sp. TaxID=1180 RepID=UPI002FFAF2B1